MRAIKQSAPASASFPAAIFGQKTAQNSPLARNMTPSEFAGHLREVHGILVSERWVQRKCRVGLIAVIRVPHYGRQLIPASEAARFAASIAAPTTEAAA